MTLFTCNSGHLLTEESASDFLKKFEAVKTDYAALVKEVQ